MDGPDAIAVNLDESLVDRVAAFGVGLHGVLKSLTATRFKGTEFMPHNPCDSAREVFGMIQSRMMC